jgi:molybdenum cofactor guanylyltransferase
MSEGAAIAGFVLVGGKSRRMGRDKALLAYGSETLVESVALEVAKAAGSVALLGDPVRYGHLGIPIVADILPGQGPMSGLHAALRSTSAEWVLLAACDLPNIEAAFLRVLIERATVTNARCVAAKSETGLEPLCAVYHRSTLSEVELAFEEGRLRMRDLATRLGAIEIDAERRLVINVNTEDDWRVHLSEKERLA